MTRPGRNHVCDTKARASLLVGSPGVGEMLVSVLKFSSESFIVITEQKQHAGSEMPCQVAAVLPVHEGILSLFLSYQQFCSLSAFHLSVGKMNFHFPKLEECI